MQNDLIKINQKKPRILMILIGIFVFLLGFFLIWWFFLRQSDEQLQTFFSHSLSTEETIQLDNIQPSSVKELTLAQAILSQISSHSSDEGFYGDWQICTKENLNNPNYVCTPNMYPYEAEEGTNEYFSETASYRYSLPVIWSRFKYYQKTKDQEQLAFLEKDLNNLSVYLKKDQKRLLNTDTYTCSLMEEIINSDLVNSEVKNLALEICFLAVPEVSPQSNINYALHTPYRFLSGINQNDPSGVMTDGKKHEAENLKNFNSHDLITKINDNIRLIINGKLDQKNNFNQNSANFAQKELIAAIDLNSKIKLAAQKEDLTSKTQATLDNLILTEETLSWFIQSPRSFSNLDICLLKSNLSLYLTNYPESLNNEEREKFQKTLNSTVSDLIDQVICNFSLYYSQKNFDKKSLVEKISEQQNLMQNNLPGYTYRSQIFEDIYGEIFPIKINALLAGLLSL